MPRKKKTENKCMEEHNMKQQIIKELMINGMTEIDDVLAMIADKVVNNDKDGAIDSINELRDYFEEQNAHEAHGKKHLDAIKKENEKTFYEDARDQHLIHQNFNRAVGKK